MWIVRLALRRPYSVAVVSIFLIIMGVLSIEGMPVDIFPTIDIPVVAIVWNYNGLSATDMERRVVLLDERALSTTVNGISRIESESINSLGLMRVYFEPGTDIGAAIAQISALGNTIVHSMPPGIQPPIVIQFNASNVPVAQLTLSSKTLPEEELFDYGLNFIRVSLFTIPGLATPAPYGGKNRQISVDIDPAALAARGLSPSDVVLALQSSNVIVPAGTARIGDLEYNIETNSSPSAIDQFNQIPVKVVNGHTVLLGDVAHVALSFAPQTNIVRVNGRRSTYLALLKKANASTLAVVQAVKDKLPEIQGAAPNGMNLKIDFDQSVYVRATIDSLLREAVIATILVSLLILIFLGSWRSVVIVCTSIPLAVMTAIIGLKLTGNTMNIMTLGGLSLAIGMLVDDATVAIENIHRNRSLGKPLTVAILDGSQQIALPAIMATFAICIVFFPVVLLTGPARYLFTPMALAVVIAMIASYLLSRTLVPALSRALMRGEAHAGSPEYKAQENKSQQSGQPPSGPLPSKGSGQALEKKGGNWIARFSRRFNERRDKIFERFQSGYGRILERMLHIPGFVLVIAGLIMVVSLFLPNYIGTDFFPTSDTGMMKMHMRAPVGTRLEATEDIVSHVEEAIRRQIPEAELSTINVNIGVPTFYNLAFVSTDNTSAMDADFLISLQADHHPTASYMNKLRAALATEFPGSVFYFQSADIVSQVLNFGLTSPIDVQIQGPNLDTDYKIARTLRDQMKTVPGAADVVIKEVLDYPAIRVNVDRTRAAEMGLTEQNVTNSMLISLSSSGLLAPSFFLNPVNNVNYNVIVQTPLDKVTNVSDLLSTPITGQNPLLPSEQQVTTATALQNEQTPPTTATDLPHTQTESLGNLVTVTTTSEPNEINHYTVQRILDITSNVEGRPLGSIASDIQAKVNALGKLPNQMKIAVRGQNEVMTQSFRIFALGIILAIVLVYLLMVLWFQSWLDPFIIMIAVPGALIGILWMLAITGTTINVVSLMGSIMAIGIAVSNSVLLVNFANDIRVEEHHDAFDAALEAGKTRLRPVLMTALAMIIGMIPMALGLGEGGEQNAPLGRAVIGGLIMATFVTLFIVPIAYSLLRKKLPSKHIMEERFQAEEQGKEFDEHAEERLEKHHSDAPHADRLGQLGEGEGHTAGPQPA
ncbi:MAG TPA: efflux RND transporter permease subunit [Candidatus Kapabacteria bacterium]|jgi:multidrug efflux pump subunit AcrB|nr:efflux RND transporter permease subunit [Candidatus Kapabacteria bacterium]